MPIDGNVDREEREKISIIQHGRSLRAPFDYSVLEVDRRNPHRHWSQKGYKDRTVR
jgi:hypothetical protein